MRKAKDGSYTLSETQAVTWSRNMLLDYDTEAAKTIDLRIVKE